MRRSGKMRLGVLEKKIILALYIFRLQNRPKLELRKTWWSNETFSGYDVREILKFLRIPLIQKAFTEAIPNSVYYALKRLEEKGLIKRFSGYYEYDRKMIAELTEKGERIAKKLMEQIARTVSHFMHILKAAQMEVVAK